MKTKRISLIFALSFYLMQLPFVLMFTPLKDIIGDNILIYTLLATVIVFIIYLISMLMLHLKIRNIELNIENINDLRKSILYVKLITIPFFIFNFILYFGFFSIFLIIGLISMPFAIIAIIVTGFFMFMTSTYIILIMIKFYKQGIISTKAFLLLLLLQLVFLLDIIGAIILYSKTNVRK